MHEQSRNPFHERSHRISLMPLQADAFDWTIIAYMIAGTAGVVGFILWSAM